MRNIVLLLLLVLMTVGAAVAEDNTDDLRQLDYHSSTDWVIETPGVTAGAIGGFINPAAWMTLQRTRPEGAFWWNDRSVRSGALDNWGFSTSGPLGFGANSQVFKYGEQTYRVTDWQLGLSGGDRRARMGMAYRWATGDNELLQREPAFVAGILSRPHSLLSFGMVGSWSTKTRSRQGVFDLGIRPMGNDKFTLYGDYTLNTTDNWDNGRWGAGVTFRPVAGLHLGVTARDNRQDNKVEWIANIGLTLEDFGFHWLPRWGTDGNMDQSTFVARFNPPTRNLTNNLRLPAEKQARFAPVGLENKYLTYQRYKYMDNWRVSWLELMAYLDGIEEDPDITGLVINLSDFKARPSLKWELRQRLERMQADGKEVIILANRLDQSSYYLASVADYLMVDPEGAVGLQGMATGRTYFKDMLEKVGVGYQELRYFKYKSAAEVGARMDMSEGQREQSQRLVDVIYEELREKTCASRGLTYEEYDAIVNDEVAMTATEAKERGLIDAVGRHEDLMKWIRQDRRATLAIPHYSYLPGAYPEEHWGDPPRIAVVYAVGACDMDTGIKGRATSKYLNRLAKDPSVKAVVLRADSPGGDPLPSDLVAGALQNLRDAGKPVIISQGDVAASGGYWISMNGQEIMTTPLTITGSIGVIGAWVYVDGMDEKLGLKYDGVRRGDHADLLRTLTVPGIGLQLPQRGLDEKELALAKKYIIESYDNFVSKVAAGRGLSEEVVREVAQGRVWMGGDALEHGLVDSYGGLSDAIALARAEAGLSSDDEVDYVEFPPQPLFDWAALFGRNRSMLGFPFGLLAPVERAVQRLEASAPWNGQPEVDVTATAGFEPFDYSLWFLEAMSARNGKPQAIMSPDLVPAEWVQPD